MIGTTGAADSDGSVTWFGACGLSIPPAAIEYRPAIDDNVEKIELEHTLMKPVTMAIIGALVVAVAVFGYLYYQRTRNDITIQMPKIELKP
ncbi:hypothetical protein QEV83_08865 [Methylocapsa sp. D3K7]|jgi:hypothetical protein|uniref:hypothetical protein n=1 Tax=Methylocapsa sp. D3K7 TaxID=3041435 RepID=UPI00244E9F8F|nr:hypothetical protein [Methylocapsa sp. D3K7]WGJ16331.1 hypothetical protein QEV83_08865 [Methylocapsa sp. D3K7]